MLLHALARVERLLELRVEVCHVDHKLRPDSGEDAVFVKGLAEKLGFVAHVVELKEMPKGANLEGWARRERYAALAQVMQSRGLSVLLTAHNANDVAETLLMRLVANKELTSIEEFDPRRRLIRPLLDISREQIDAYVQEHGLAHVEDSTNLDTTFTRNRIRHEVVPLLAERFDPSIVWILADRARALADDAQALREVAQVVGDSIGPFKSGDAEWFRRCRSELSRFPYAIQWRVTQRLFTPELGFSVGESRAQAILKVLVDGCSGLDLGEGVRLEVSGAALVLS